MGMGKARYGHDMGKMGSVTADRFRTILSTFFGGGALLYHITSKKHGRYAKNQRKKSVPNFNTSKTRFGR